MKNRLAIFDLDGTLYDTCPVNFQSYQLALRKYHIELDEKFFRTNCNGQYYKQFLPQISATLSERDVEKIHEMKKEFYHSCLSCATVNEHLIQIICNIRQNYHIALVTTASRRNAEEILRFFGHYTLFNLMIAQEDVVRKKPDPEGFLKAMRFFDVRPEHTIIFEDSESGIRAAISSGASVHRVLDFCSERSRSKAGILRCIE